MASAKPNSNYQKTKWLVFVGERQSMWAATHIVFQMTQLRDLGSFDVSWLREVGSLRAGSFKSSYPEHHTEEDSNSNHPVYALQILH